MINVNDIDKIKALFSAIFFFGLSHDYSPEFIEKQIVNASFVASLETRNDSSFLYRQTLLSSLREVYPLSNEELEESIRNTNALCLWLGEAYVRLFFAFHKSFAFLFLYFPLSLGIRSFHVYHEMDFGQLCSYFQQRTEEKTLIDLLLTKANLNYEQLSLLSGIKKATLLNYSRNNDSLFAASHHNVFLLSKVFDVPMNAFVKNIWNYPNQSMFRYNKEDPAYRSKLGLLYAQYYDKETRESPYLYDVKKSVFASKGSLFKVLWSEPQAGMATASKENPNIKKAILKELALGIEADKSQLSLAVFEYGKESDSIAPYLPLRELGLKNVFIINARYFFQINANESKTRQIEDRVNEFLTQRASMAEAE